MLDLALAATHHLLFLAIAALLSVEFALLRPGLSADGVSRLGKIDRAYGGLAVAIVVVGIGRVLFGLKSWEFYVHNPFFWAKMGVFVAVGVISIQPTLAILRWGRALRHGGGQVAAAEIEATRLYVTAQLALFALIPILAATMARGIGY